VHDPRTLHFESTMIVMVFELYSTLQSAAVSPPSKSHAPRHSKIIPSVLLCFPCCMVLHNDEKSAGSAKSSDLVTEALRNII